MEAIVNPRAHHDLYARTGATTGDETVPVDYWSWDAETKTKAQGFLVVLSSFKHIAPVVILKNCLEPVKPLAAKLQKRDQDAVEAYTDLVIPELEEIRTDIDTISNE